MEEIIVFQPAREIPKILNIISSHFIGDLLNKFFNKSFEKIRFEEQASGPVHNLKIGRASCRERV